ncbi:MAG: hypothetical protein IJ027_01390 [Oscillospiraceae bacterium]|nr:hypothetical protein [Oscillospiraceae bacterium]
MNPNITFNKPWDEMFSDLPAESISLTKKIVYNCIEFANDMLNSKLFFKQTLDGMVECVLFAKMHCYHYITTAHTLHYLFYGYLYEYFTHFRSIDQNTVSILLTEMQESERYYLHAYSNMDTEEKKLLQLLKIFYVQLTEKRFDYFYIISASYDEFSKTTGELLLKMLLKFNIPI